MTGNLMVVLKVDTSGLIFWNCKIFARSVINRHTVWNVGAFTIIWINLLQPEERPCIVYFNILYGTALSFW